MNIEQIEFAIIERFAETRITHNLANYKIEATRREAYNEVAVRLRARMVDDIIWTSRSNRSPVVAEGIWNNVKQRLPAWLVTKLGGVSLVDTVWEHHIHHTCPHITIPIDNESHFEWMRQKENYV